MNHQDRVRRNYDRPPYHKTPDEARFRPGQCGEETATVATVQADRPDDVPTADMKIEALMADIRGTIYVDKMDVWHIRQLARALVRKGWNRGA